MAIVYDPTSDSYYDDGTSQTEVGPIDDGASGVYPINSGYNPNTTPSSGEYRTEVTPAPALTVEEVLAESPKTTGISGFNEAGEWVGSVNSQGYNPNASPSSGVDRGKTLEQIQGGGEDSFFSKLSTSFKDDMTKNPLGYLKMGLDGFANAQKSQATVEAARVAQQGRLEQQNNQAALDQQAKDKYTASLGGIGKKPVNRKQAPLTRTNGTPVYDLQGNVKGYK